MATQKRYGRFLPGEDDKTLERRYKDLSKKELLHVAKYLDEIYGINHKALKEYEFMKKKDDLWLVSKKATTLIPFERQGLKVNTIGFRAMRNSFTNTPKITTNFAQFLGSKIKKNIRELTENELEIYIHGHDIDANGEFIGYCVLKYGKNVIGVGLYKDNIIKNQIPKGRSLKNLLVSK